jgi:tetratricopeptide (TPR) repeat protein
MPVALSKKILEQARELQDKLFRIAEPSLGLRFSRAQALEKTAELLLVLLRDTKGALDAASQAHDIFKVLLESSPDDIAWQYDLSAIDNTIGDVLNAQGRLDEALAAYSESLGIAKGLARKIPGNAPLLQRSLSNSDLGIGDILKQQGHLDNALAAYRDALVLTKRSLSSPTWPGLTKGSAKCSRRRAILMTL